jgi:hypothetical protein
MANAATTVTDGESRIRSRSSSDGPLPFPSSPNGSTTQMAAGGARLSAARSSFQFAARKSTSGRSITSRRCSSSSALE